MFGSFDLLSNMKSTLCINTNIFVYKNIVQQLFHRTLYNSVQLINLY